MEGIQLARAYVEFESNFRDVIEDQKKVVKESKKAHDTIQSHIKKTVSSWIKVQEETQNTAKEIKSMASSAGRAFGGMSTAFGAFTSVLSFGVGVLGQFNRVLITIARSGLSMIRISIQAAIKMLNELLKVILRLMRRLAQMFTFIATLPARIALAVNHARKNISKWLDDMTKKFVFLQLDIRHIMQLMQRFLLVTVGAMGAATAASAAFENQFVVVRRVTEMAAEEYEKLERRLRSTASEIGRSATELAELASVAGRLGIEGVQNLEDFARIMGKLGVATTLHGEKAATEFARLMTVMNISQRDMNNLASTIVQLGNQFAAFEDEILAMSLQLAGAGSAIGVTVQEILGLSTAMAAVDIRVERGGSAMSRVMIEVANAVSLGGEALETFAELAGMTADTFVETFRRDPMDAIFGFLKGLSEMADLPFKTLQDLNLAQIRTRDVVLRLLSAQEQLGRALDTSNIAWEENIALQREYEVAMDTVIAQGRKLIENFVELGRRIGDLFGEELKDAIKLMIDFVQTLQSVDDEVYRAVAGLLTLVSVIVGVTAGILVLARGFFTVLTAVVLVTRAFVFFGTVLGAMWLARKIIDFFFRGLNLNPYQLAIELFDAMRLAIDSLVHAFVTSDIGTIMTDAFRDIRKEWQKFRSFIADKGELEDELGREMTDLEWMVRIAEEFFNTITRSMNIVSDMITNMRDLISDPEYNLWEDLTEPGIDTMTGAVLTPEQMQVREAVHSMAKAFRDMITTAFELAFKDIPGLFADAMINIVFPSVWGRMEGDEGWLAGAEESILGWAETIDEWTLAVRASREGTTDEPFFPENVSALLSAIWELGKSAGALFWEGLKWAYENIGGPEIAGAFSEILEDIGDMIWDIDWPTLVTVDPETKDIEFHWEVLQDDSEMNETLSEFVKQAVRIYSGLLYQTFMAIIHIPPWHLVGRMIVDGLLKAISALIPGFTFAYGDEGFDWSFDFWDLWETLSEFDFDSSAYGFMLSALKSLSGYLHEDLPEFIDNIVDRVKSGADVTEDWIRNLMPEDLFDHFENDTVLIETVLGVTPTEEQRQEQEKVDSQFKRVLDEIIKFNPVEMWKIFRDPERSFIEEYREHRIEYDEGLNFGLFALGERDLSQHEESVNVLVKLYDELKAKLGEGIVIPFEFVMALAEEESTFRFDAVGDEGTAFGMLQVRDLAAQDAADWYGEQFPEFDISPLKDNVLAGMLYAQGMYERFEDIIDTIIEVYDEIESDVEALMVMYRWGYSRFVRAAKGEGTWPTLASVDIRRIETLREYGDLVEGFEQGAILAGYGGGDTVPALLEQGEAIVPKEAVRGGATGISEWFKSQGVPGFQAGFIPEFLQREGRHTDVIFNQLQGLHQTFQEMDLGFDTIAESIGNLSDTIYSIGDTLINAIGWILTKLIDILSVLLDLDVEQEEWLNEIKDDLLKGLENILRRYQPEPDIDVMTGAAPPIEPRFFSYQLIDEGPVWEAADNALRRFIIRTSSGGKRLAAIMEELGDGFSTLIQGPLRYFLSDLEDPDTRGIFDQHAEDLIYAAEGVRHTFQALQDTELASTFRTWLDESDSIFASILQGFANIPETATNILSQGWELLAKGLDQTESMIGINFGELAIHASELAGAFGGMLTGLMSLIIQTESFQKAMEIFEVIWEEIVAIVDPLGEVFIALANAIRPIVQMIAAVLTPIMQLLANILIGIIKVLATLWNVLLTILNTLTFGVLGLDRFMIDISTLTDGLEDLNDEISSARRNVPRIFRDAYAIWTLGHGTLPGEEIAEEEEEDEKGILSRIWDAITWLPKKIWEVVSELGFFKTALLGAGVFLLQKFTGIPGKIISFLGSALSGVGSKLWGILPEAVTGFFGKAAGGITGLFGKAVSGVKGFLGIGAAGAGVAGAGAAGSFASTALASYMPALYGKASLLPGLAPMIPTGATVGATAGVTAGATAGGGGILAGLSGLVGKLGGGIKALGAALGPIGIAAVAAGGLAYFFRDDLKEMASRAWETITSIAGSAWETIKGVGSGVFNTLKEGLSGIFGAIRSVAGGIWEGAKGVAGGLWEGAKGIAGGIASGVKSVAGGLVSGVKTVASGLRNLLPFAQGGIVKSPLMGLIGESGPEAVIPLDRLQGILAGVFKQEKFVQDQVGTALAAIQPIQGGIGGVSSVDRIISDLRSHSSLADSGIERVLNKVISRPGHQATGDTIIIEGDVYGFEDFSRKVHQAKARIDAKNKKNRYGIR